MILNPGGKVLPNLDALAFGEQTALPAEGRTDPAYYEAIADAIAQRTAEGGITLVPLSVTENGNYTPSSGEAYSQVSVAVPTGGGLQIVVTAPTGATVTATKDGVTYIGVENPENPGNYTIGITQSGVYEINVSYNKQDKSALAQTAIHFDLSQGWVPSDYTLLKYIEGEGTQYINLLEAVSSDSKFEMDAQFSETVGSSLIGTDINNRPALWIYAYTTVYSEYVVYVSNYYDKCGAVNTLRHLFTVDIPNGTFLIDESQYALSARTATSTAPLYLMAVNEDGYPSNFFVGKYYSFKWYKSNSLFREMYPVKRNSDNAVGMFDTMTQTFFANAGSGNFIPGPEVS